MMVTHVNNIIINIFYPVLTVYYFLLPCCGDAITIVFYKYQKYQEDYL